MKLQVKTAISSYNYFLSPLKTLKKKKAGFVGNPSPPVHTYQKLGILIKCLPLSQISNIAWPKKNTSHEKTCNSYLNPSMPSFRTCNRVIRNCQFQFKIVIRGKMDCFQKFICTKITNSITKNMAEMTCKSTRKTPERQFLLIQKGKCLKFSPQYQL